MAGRIGPVVWTIEARITPRQTNFPSRITFSSRSRAQKYPASTAASLSRAQIQLPCSSRSRISPPAA